MMRFDLWEPYAQAVALALGAGVLEAVALALLVAGTARLSRSSATTRHVLWWIALSACAALPVVAIASSFAHVRHVAAGTAALAAGSAGHESGPRRTRRGSAGMSSPESTSRERGPVTPAESAVAPATGTAYSPFSLFEAARTAAGRLAQAGFAATLLVVLWLAVALLKWARLAFGVAALGRIKRSAIPLDESVVKRLRRWRHSARTGRSVALAVSNDIDVPVAIGFRSPTILLPAAVVETQEIADIDQIAMHEYAHLERYDDWSNLFQRAIECALWFSPAVAYIGRRISLEREVACDDWVVAQTGRAHRYATCLWKLVESSRLPATPVVAPGALLTPKDITIRIERLLDSRRNALPRLSPLGALALGALAIAGTIVQAQHAPAIALADPVCPSAVHQASQSSRAARAGRVDRVDRSGGAEPARNAGRAPLPADPAGAKARALAEAHGPADAAATARKARVLAELHAATSARAEAPAAALPALPALPATAAAPPAPPAPPRSIDSAELRLATAGLADAARHVAQAASPARAARDEPYAGMSAAEAQALAKRTSGAVADSLPSTVSAAVSGAARALQTGGPLALAQLDRSPTPASLDRAGIAACSGCDLRHKDLRGLDLHGISLAGADLNGADLRGADLSGANLSGDVLNHVRFDGANLSGATIEGSELHGASFANANLDGVKMIGTELGDANFSGTHLRSILDECSGCDLRHLDLRAQDLHGIDLEGADLRGTDLSGADLSGAHFTGVDLRGANFDRARLHDAVFRGCDWHAAERERARAAGASIDASNQ